MAGPRFFSNLPHSLSWPAFLWLASFSSKFFWQQDNIFRSSGIYFTSLTISVGRQRCCSNNLTQIQGLLIICSYLGQSQCTGCCCILIGWWVILSPLDPEVGISPLWMDWDCSKEVPKRKLCWPVQMIREKKISQQNYKCPPHIWYSTW